MKEKSFIFVIVLLLVSLIFSCESVIYETHSSELFVSMTTPKGISDYEVIGELNYETKAVFLVLQLITITDAEIEQAIEKQVRKLEGDGIINLRIHEQYVFVDFIISVFGGGIVSTRTVKVNGDIIKMNPASATKIPDIDDQIELAILGYNRGVVR